MTSAVSEKGWPPAGPAEVAFVGRSNVGKSSLINCLVRRKKLVRTSSRPGCTQQVNFFNFNNDAFRFVDLPGYGFAKVPLSVKATWGAMIERYLLKRQCLSGVVVILDIRRDLNPHDMGLLAWLNDNEIPWLPVFTKADKLSRNQVRKNLASLSRQIGPSQVAPVLFSALSGQGVPELWEALQPWLEAKEAPEQTAVLAEEEQSAG